MDSTVLLYALSTLAQSAAALAAFVGAVGIYQLQTLHWRREALYQDIWRTQGSPTMTSQETLSQARDRADKEPTTARLLRQFAETSTAIQRFRTTLRVFECVTLAVVLLSLVGFVGIGHLARWPLIRTALVFLSSAAVGATAWMLLNITQPAAER